MRPQQLLKFIPIALQARQRVLIKGIPGGGKSDLVAEACEAAKFNLQISHPSVSDPTDYKGMPAVIGDGTKAEFLPFGDLQRLIEADRPTVCFLDDIGQAPPAVQAALMQLMQARRVNGHRISDHVVFCGATNDTKHCAGVSGLIEPVKSRWDTLVTLDISTDDWCLWALDHGMPAMLIAFVRSPAITPPRDPSINPHLCDFQPTRELVNSPCPRTVAAAGRWLNAGVTDHEVFAGACGEAWATEFDAFRTLWGELPDFDALLLDPMGAPIPEKTSAQIAVCCGLAHKLTPHNVERGFAYLGRLKKEYEVMGVIDALRLKPELRNTRTFVAWGTKNAGVLA